MTDFAEKPQDETPEPAEEPGDVIATYAGTIALRALGSWDAAGEDGPAEPDALTVVALQDAIDKAITGFGYAVTVRLTRTDK